MGGLSMIVISTYNPDTQRTTQDESLLTTLLIALIRERAYSSVLEQNSKNELSRQAATETKTNCDRLIGLVFPLLGLEITEVYELLRQEEHKCQIDLIGKK